MVVQRLTLTAEQTKKMDDIFQQSRLQLIDLKANVEKQQVMLEPMLSANPLDVAKASAQIDKVAEARADLEKANAKMLLGIRGVLTPDQWTKLRDLASADLALPASPALVVPAPASAPGGPGGRGRGMRGGGPPPAPATSSIPSTSPRTDLPSRSTKGTRIHGYPFLCPRVQIFAQWCRGLGCICV